MAHIELEEYKNHSGEEGEFIDDLSQFSECKIQQKEREENPHIQSDTKILSSKIFNPSLQLVDLPAVYNGIVEIDYISESENFSIKEKNILIESSQEKLSPIEISNPIFNLHDNSTKSSIFFILGIFINYYCKSFIKK